MRAWETVMDDRPRHDEKKRISGIEAVRASEMSAAGMARIATDASARMAAVAPVEKMILTTGCFDLFHFGHLKLLEWCASHGRLIVGVNGDRVVATLKKGRPIIPVDERIAILKSLRCVSEVVVFHEDTPATLIRTLKPDWFVKGKGYAAHKLPEVEALLEYGGILKIFDQGLDVSTTQIISKIRSMPEGT